MKHIYNKLVRDRIPEIIEAGGAKANYRVLSRVEYIEELKKKLAEEVEELCNAATEEELIEEMADVRTVLDYISLTFDLDGAVMLKRRDQKHTERGGFRERIFLESTED